MIVKRILAPALAVYATMAAVAATPPELNQLASTRIQTLQLDSSVVEENRAQLNTIGGDFAQAYRIHKVSIAYLQPSKIHFESVVLNVHIAYTINGDRKFTSVPTYHVHKVENITGQPGKRQSLLDLGLVPPELFDYSNATYVGTQGNLLIYDIKPKQDRYKDRVWIDPVTHITTKRIHFTREGKVQAWYMYKDPIEPRPHLYIPTRVEVYDPANELAAVTQYTNVKVNLPVDSTIFDF